MAEHSGEEMIWALGDYNATERKQWRYDRFREWFFEEYLTRFQTKHDPEAVCLGCWKLASQEHLVGRGVFLAERFGRSGISRY